MDDALALLLFFAGVAGAFVADAAVFALVRRRRPAARRGIAHALALLAALALVAFYFACAPISPAWLIPGLAMVVCNAYVGFHLDNMAETARRIRILRELHDAPAGLSRAAVLAAYPPSEVFERRIERLKLAGQLGEVQGRLRLTGASYSIAQSLVSACARIVFGRAARRAAE